MTDTKKVITVVDKATKALEKANTDITKTMSTLNELVTKSNELAFEIEMKASELSEVENAIKAKEREAQADLQIRIKENEALVIDQLLEKNKLAKIPTSDLDRLSHELAEAKKSNEQEINNAVKEAEAKLHAHYSSKLTEIRAEHKVTMAQFQADNQALSEKVQDLRASNEGLCKMIDEERNARVEMSRNASQPTINVNGNK